MAKVLVTGASGFIGSHLVRALVARGETVTCLVRRTSAVERLRSEPVAFVCGDVTDGDAVRGAVAGAEVVFHAAGINRALRSEELFRVNEQGVRMVAQACAGQQTPPTLVTVSSLAAAGPAVDGRARTEADVPRQVSAYGRSKRAGELAAEGYADRVPITVVRPPIVIGEADRQALPMFRAIARMGIHFVPGLGRQRFSLIHAADLAELLILAGVRGRRLQPRCPDEPWSPCGYYFAACEQDPSYAELGRLIGAALGRLRTPVVATLPRAIWVVATVNELASRILRRPAVLNWDKAREATSGSWLCSAQTASDQLGFAPGATLLERLRQTVQWYQAERWL